MPVESQSLHMDMYSISKMTPLPDYLTLGFVPVSIYKSPELTPAKVHCPVRQRSEAPLYPNLLVSFAFA